MGRLRKLVSILVITAMILPYGTLAAGAKNDISNHWAKEEIEYLLGENIVSGYADGTFRPDQRITRAEFIKIINSVFGYSEIEQVQFADVKKGDWFYDEIGKAVAAGYIGGYTDGTMRPNNPISRQEVSKIMGVVFGLDETKSKSANSFVDSYLIGDWAKGYVSIMKDKGYISGYPDGTFRPTSPITRAEAVKIITNASGNIINAPGQYSEDADGNVLVNTPNVVLKDMDINGDLYLTEGIGDGDVVLDNVRVYGETHIRGGGEHSITIRNSSLGQVVVKKENSKIRVVIDENTEVSDIVVDENIILVIKEGAKVESIRVTGEANIEVEKGAGVGTIEVEAKNVEIKAEGKIDSIVAEEDVKVNGKVVEEGKEVKVENGKVEEVKEEEERPKPGTGGGGGGRDDGGSTEPEPEEPEEPTVIPVSGVKVAPRVLTLKVGETGQITATVEPANATNKKVTWSSSNPNIANVDNNGEITAINNGIATITATSAADNTKTASCTVFVANDWSDLADTSWYTGEGPYTISTAQELAGLALLVNRDEDPVDFEGKTIVLNADIDLVGLEWIPIGFINETTEINDASEYDRCSNVFKGSFNGNNHTISNLKIDKDDYKAVGLFGVISLTENAEIKDINLVNATVSGYTGVGVLAGMARAGTKWVSGIGHAAQISGIKVSNATVTGLKYIGGVIGYSTASIKDSSASNVEIIANYKTGMAGKSGETAGGIVGNLYDNYSITNCTVTNSTIVSQTRAGGIAGSSQHARDISYCTVSDLNIKLIKSDDADAENEGYAGYISGRVKLTNIKDYTNNVVENSTAIIFGEVTEISYLCSPVESINVEPKTMELVAGDTGLITVTVSPDNVSNKKIIWLSSNPNVATVNENGVVTAVGGGETEITAISAADSSKKDTCKVIVHNPGTITKTAFWGTPDNVLYYFDFELGYGFKIGDLTSLVARAYAGDTLLSTISLKEEKFKEYADRTSLGGSFRSNPEASPSSSWNLEAFDGTMPTEIVIEYTTKNGKTYTFGIQNIEWKDEGYQANVEAQDFGVMTISNVMGYSVGFKLINATASDVQQIVVKLYKEERVLATNTSTAGLIEQYPNESILSAPFDVFGEFNYEEDNCWNYSGWRGDNKDIPTKAEVIVTFKNGVVKAATNERLTGDTSIFTKNVINVTQKKAFDTIQDAIDGATKGDNIIKVYPGDYGIDPIDIIQKEGVNITLEAVGKVVLKNQIRISGAGRHNGKETLTIKGFTFDYSDASEDVDIIIATAKLLDDTNNYAHNIKIENNKFIGNSQVEVVAIRTKGVFGLEISNCEGVSLHSLGQIQGQSKYFRVYDCEVTGGESGINYYGPSDLIVENFLFNGTGYGIRAGQSSGSLQNSELIIIDSELVTIGSEDEKAPIVLRGDAPKEIEISNSTLINENGYAIYSTVDNDGEDLKLVLDGNYWGNNGFKIDLIHGLDNANITGSDVLDTIVETQEVEDVVKEIENPTNEQEIEDDEKIEDDYVNTEEDADNDLYNEGEVVDEEETVNEGEIE